MLGFYISFYSSILSAFTSCIVLFYIVANPYIRITHSVLPFYVAFSTANIFQCIGVFVGEKYCVSFGFYLYISGLMYMAYTNIILGVAFVKSITSGDILINFQPFKNYFIWMHVFLIIQITLTVWLDDQTTSNLYCDYNIDFKSANYNILMEPFPYIMFYPLILVATLAILSVLYASYYLDVSYSGEALQPLVKRLRFYFQLVGVVLLIVALFIFVQIGYRKFDILYKCFACLQPLSVIVFNVDFFLFMNRVFNDRKEQRAFAIGADTASSQPSTLHAFFRAWDSYMGFIPKSRNGGGTMTASQDALLDHSKPPSECLDRMTTNSNPYL